MSFTLNAVLSLLVGFPAAIGWVQFRKIDPSFYPFLILLTAAFANEVTSIALILSGEPNAVPYNLYSLFESTLLLWQFARWQTFRRRAVYLALQGGLFLLWCWESFIYSSLLQFNSFHLVGYSSVIALVSITYINRLVYTEPGPLFRNAAFLICTALLIFNTYTVLVELFWLHGLNKDSLFRIQILSIMPYFNLLSNLLFTLAVLWAPINYRFIMRL